MGPIFDDITAVCDLRQGMQQGAACRNTIFFPAYLRTPPNGLVLRQKYPATAGRLRPRRRLPDKVAAYQDCAEKVAPQNDPGK